MKIWLALILALTWVPGAFGQSNPTKGDSLSWTSDVVQLLAHRGLNRKDLQSQAEKLVKRYREELRHTGSKVSGLEGVAQHKLGQLDWRQKFNLVSELWRVRSSIDLMCILSPDVLSQLTGIEVGQLTAWKERLDSVARAVKRSVLFLR